MKPSIRRIVHVADQQGSTLPAIITKVISDDEIRVRVFNDEAGDEVRTVHKVSWPPKGVMDWNWPPRE